MTSFRKCIAGRIVGTAEKGMASTVVAGIDTDIGRPAMNILAETPERFLDSTGVMAMTMTGPNVARKKTRIKSFCERAGLAATEAA